MPGTKKKLKETQTLRKTAEFLADFLTHNSVPIKVAGGIVVECGETTSEDHGGVTRNWVSVTHQGFTGFIDETFLAPVSDDIAVIPGFQAFDLEVPRERFADACFTQALLAETNAAYLYALAFAESGEHWSQTTVKAPDDNHGGVFRYTQSTWDGLLKSLKKGSPASSDLRFPVAQCMVSAAFAGKAQAGLEKALEDREVDGLALYVAHIFGSDVKSGVKAAETFIKATADTPLADVLGDFAGNDLTALEPLKQRRPILFAAPTVGKFLEICAQRLDAGYKETREFGHEITEQLPKTPAAPVFTGKFDGPVIDVTEEDVEALAAVSQSEVAIFKTFGEEQFKGGIHAVIDTIFNRVVYPSTEFANSIQEEIVRPFQFSALNNLGDWRKLPAPTAEILAITRSFVEARSKGLESEIRGATHFFNPRKSDPSWGPYLLANKVAVYGRESTQNVHFHGFASAQYKPPKPYAISFEGNLTPFRGDGTRLPGAQKLPPDVVTGPASAKTLPDTWKPPANMKRIILHWTAGRHKASGLDRHHYHIMVEDDGNLVLGKFSIKANERPVSGGYAPHTRGTNTGSIGISVCCMRDAKESPFNPGPSPMTKVQWDTMMAVVADLCRTYNIAVTPQTVLGHGEVQKNLGNRQTGKWDPMKLPWDKAASKQEVGERMRAQVSALL